MVFDAFHRKIPTSNGVFHFGFIFESGKYFFRIGSVKNIYLQGMNTIFHISLALLDDAKTDLLQLDFEGTLK